MKILVALAMAASLERVAAPADRRPRRLRREERGRRAADGKKG
ncbi:MAG TPA: hypothetical protein VFB01_02375 [Burkholderiales bacterium]|nr:hypothetical protein [Burkholderiales bacterium]